MPRFERAVELPVSAGEAFAWHMRPGAFDRLRPPWQKLDVVARPAALTDGSRLTFRLRRGPIVLRWVAAHRDVVDGEQFRDVQIAGPFKSWDHTHRFESPDGDPLGCTLVDSIDYELPFGPLGRFLGSGMVRRDLERVFRFRHRLTTEDLEMQARYRERPRLRVAIAGAGGLVGSALAAMLSTGGHEVVRLVRNRDGGQDGEAGWDPTRGLRQPERLEGLDALVYLAGASIAGGRWTDRRKRELVRSRVDAVRRLLDDLGKLERPPGTFLGASAVGIYGDRGAEQVDETAALGEGFLAELARRWEDAATGASSWGARVAVARLGVVLSPRGGALAKMLPAFLVGAGGPLGSGKQVLSWISLDDAAGALHHALHTEALEGPFHVTAPGALPQGEFARILGRVLRRPTVIPTPAVALRLIFGEMAAETLLAGVRALPSKLEASGYRFRQPELEDALRHELGAASRPS